MLIYIFSLPTDDSDRVLYFVSFTPFHVTLCKLMFLMMLFNNFLFQI